MRMVRHAFELLHLTRPCGMTSFIRLRKLMARLQGISSRWFEECRRLQHIGLGKVETGERKERPM
jgi:hypothetical protein